MASKAGATKQDRSLRKARDLAIYHMRLNDAAYSKICETFDLTPARVSQILNDRERLRSLVEDTASMNYVLLPLAPWKLQEIIIDGNHRDALNAIKLLYEVTGIKQPQTSDQNIINIHQQIFQDNSTKIGQETGLVREFFRWKHAQVEAAPAIDCEPASAEKPQDMGTPPDDSLPE